MFTQKDISIWMAGEVVINAGAVWSIIWRDAGCWYLFLAGFMPYSWAVRRYRGVAIRREIALGGPLSIHRRDSWLFVVAVTTQLLDKTAGLMNRYCCQV